MCPLVGRTRLLSQVSCGNRWRVPARWLVRERVASSSQQFFCCSEGTVLAHSDRVPLPNKAIEMLCPFSM